MFIGKSHMICKRVCHKSLAFSSHSVPVSNIAQLLKVNKLIV